MNFTDKSDSSCDYRGVGLITVILNGSGCRDRGEDGGRGGSGGEDGDFGGGGGGEDCDIDGGWGGEDNCGGKGEDDGGDEGGGGEDGGGVRKGQLVDQPLGRSVAQSLHSRGPLHASIGRSAIHESFTC
ncbi:hypothetical protein DEO72_LG1g1940 [Vigna unguiculata]|uniref:Uncharacterized protein n=1 Tax=Vigna unguiculata TaxID=3917 RepID=A0A4D6KL98_VIGUN|nr:hypothetical protein DEO72_LG1g1940 [Vigna unguiculata]